MKKYITTFLLLTSSIMLYSSCNNPFFTITELLNNNTKNYHIFTCKILKTFIRGGSFESIAVVQKRFTGSPKDTVYVNSGGNTTAGGEKLMPNTVWLVFSRTKDNLHYSAAVCDHLSTEIPGGSNKKSNRRKNFFSKAYLDILAQYEIIRLKAFTGHKLVYGNGKLVAEGNFKNGLPHGDWIHYSPYNYYENKIKRSEISYHEGMLNGRYLIYVGDRKRNNVIIERRKYDHNRHIFIESNGIYKTKYEYISDTKRKTIATISDTTGVERRRIPYIELDYDNTKYSAISFKDGYYFNKMEEEASEYFPLAEGFYSKGTRVGKWTFYNKKGDIIETKIYPDSLAKTSLFQVYQEDGSVKISGLYVNEKRVGIWKYFYQSNSLIQEIYSVDGEKICRIKSSASGELKYEPFLENKKHGQQIAFNSDGIIISIENYKHGRKEGNSIFFEKDGIVKKELNYINGRAFSKNQDKNNVFYHNGFKNGHYIVYNYKTKAKSIEGVLWNGYKIGVWIEYGKNGSYTKIHYPNDKEKLMNGGGMMSIRHETYNKEGTLINSWQF